MSTVRVDLGDRSYEVVVGAGLIGRLDELVPEFPYSDAFALVTDRNVEALFADRVEQQLVRRGMANRLSVDAGEPSKSWAVAEGLLEQMADLRLRRSDPLLALGGGMVLDLGGFVASVYQRGVPLVSVPTTLLAQVDAAVGGKTGVNLTQGKNLAGTFHQPSVVVADVETLATLPEQEFRSGLAEVAKYGLSLDAALLQELENSIDRLSERDPGILERVVTRCVEIKAGLIASDEREMGDRVLLNYGHTLGHALESLSGYQGWRHGEAISVGMTFAAALSSEAGLLDESSVRRHSQLLERLGLPVSASAEPDEIIERWKIDKKYRGGPRWVLLKGIGEAVVETGVDETLVRRALDRVLTP